MAKKQPQLPPELSTFIKQDETTFHCDDGDWDLKIESRDDSDFKDELPPRSTVIAENGCGDCLFLKSSAAGKIDSKVFVYWHEEERAEMFAKSIKELIATSAKNKAAAAKAPKTAKAPASKASIADVEKAHKDKERPRAVGRLARVSKGSIWPRGFAYAAAHLWQKTTCRW